MNKNLLTQIHKNLYDVESSVEVSKKDFEKNNINVEIFLATIRFYIDNFYLLKDIENESLLNLLDEKLRYIIRYYEKINLYEKKIKSSINFIEKHKTSFFRDIQEDEFSYLNSIKIKNYFSIKDIEIINLKDKREIYFVGANGDGKTILLQAIVLALKKEYSGQIIEYIRDEKKMNLSVKDELSEEYNSNKNIKNVFAYGINRNKVREKFDTYGYSGIFDTSDFKDTTFLKNPIDVLRNNNSLIEDFIKKLNQDILIGKLKVHKSGQEIYFREGDNDITFETLSEGYKSTIIWLCDLVFRLISNQESVNRLGDFKAIVLIDEIDLYLHPKWKYDFVYNLRKVFPNIQFIMITHSTATILGASEDAVFYKVYKEGTETKLSHPMDSIKNLMANNLSTSPLFDMTTARARNSDNKLKTDEDYIYTKIHEIVSEQVQGKKAIIEDEIVDLINQELDDYLKENDL